MVGDLSNKEAEIDTYGFGICKGSFAPIPKWHPISDKARRSCIAFYLCTDFMYQFA